MQHDDGNPFDCVQAETGRNLQSGFQHERDGQQGAYDRAVLGDIFPEIRFFHILFILISLQFPFALAQHFGLVARKVYDRRGNIVPHAAVDHKRHVAAIALMDQFCLLYTSRQ